MTTAAQGAYVIVAEFEVNPGAVDAFIEAAIGDSSGSVNNEPGCHQFDVTQSSENPNLIVLYEVYDSEAAFQEHLKTPHFEVFRDKIEPLVKSRRVHRLTRLYS